MKKLNLQDLHDIMMGCAILGTGGGGSLVEGTTVVEKQWNAGKEFKLLDFSEIPVMICAFAMGPTAGVAAELCKNLLKLVLKGTSTAFVGDFANFVVGCSLVLPASILYYIKKSKKMAMAGLALGTLVMTVFGSAFNAFYLLPKFSELYGMPMEAIIGMGSAINPSIDSVWTLVFFAVVPFNILKGVIVSIVTILLYKHISPILKKH